MTYFTRSDWGARRPRAVTPMRTSAVEGIALHWPGMSSPINNVTDVKNALRSWQRQHMDTKGWNDIAYQEAIDQDGNAYQLRGLHNQSAANGDGDTNTRYGALLLVLGPGEVPSPAMVATVRRRVAAHRELYGRSNKVVPHSAIRPDGTECPGDRVREAIKAGRFNPVTEEPEPKVTRVGLARIQILAEIDEHLASVPQDRGFARLVLESAREQILKLPEA